MLYVWYVSAVCQIEFLEELYLDHSTHLGSYCLHTHQISWKYFDLGQIYAPKMLIWCITAICQIGFLKETCLDHSTSWDTHYLHAHQISWKYRDWGQRFAFKTKFETGSLAAEFYVQFQFWQMSPFRDFRMYDPTKFQENHSTRGWVICYSTFSIPTFKPTLPVAERYSAITQAIYSHTWKMLSNFFISISSCFQLFSVPALVNVCVTAPPGSMQQADDQFLSRIFIFVAFIFIFWLMIA